MGDGCIDRGEYIERQMDGEIEEDDGQRQMERHR